MNKGDIYPPFFGLQKLYIFHRTGRTPDFEGDPFSRQNLPVALGESIVCARRIAGADDDFSGRGGFHELIGHYKTQKGPFARATFWAFLLQLNVVVYYFLIGRALHLDIHFVDYFIFIPLVLIILTIPITISGLGLREESYIEIFKFYGISAQAAVSFSLIGVAFNLVIGLIGGIIYVTRR